MHTRFTPRAQALPIPSAVSGRQQLMRLFSLVALSALTLSLMACATPIAAPTQELALSRAAIDAAARAGAAELAPGELNLARQKQQMADAAMKQEQYAQALLLSNEVQVDARLAEAKARSARANRAAGEIREDGRVLRQEINRAQ